MVLVQQASTNICSKFLAKKIKKMAENDLFNNEDLKTLNEENKINDEKFQEFHKKVFDEMMEQALFLACDI